MAKQKSLLESEEVAEVKEVMEAELLPETAPETTAMVTTVDSVPALAQSDDDFLMAEDIANAEENDQLDRLIIEQKGKKEGSVLGEFFCDGLTESYPGFESVVLLRVGSSRLLWPKTFNKDNDPLCKSNDGLFPVSDDESFTPKAAKCCDCPVGKWKKVDGKNIPPACKEVADLVLLDMETFAPFLYSVSATAMGAYNKDLKKILKGKIRGLTMRRKRAGLPPAHSCMFSFSMNTVLKENDAGDAFIPVFSDIKEIENTDETEMLIYAAKTVADKELHFGGYIEMQEDDGSGEEETQKEAF